MAGRTKVLGLYEVIYTFLWKHMEYLWDETSESTTVERVLLVAVRW